MGEESERMRFALAVFGIEMMLQGESREPLNPFILMSAVIEPAVTHSDMGWDEMICSVLKFGTIGVKN